MSGRIDAPHVTSWQSTVAPHVGVFLLQAEALEVAGVGLFALGEYHRQLMVDLGAKSANQAVHPSETAAMKEVDAVQDLQSLQDTIESAVDVRHGPIDAGLDPLEISGFVVEARERGCFCSSWADLIRKTSGHPPRLWY